METPRMPPRARWKHLTFSKASGSQLEGDFALQETFGNGDIFVVMMAEGVGGHATAGI